MANDTHQKGAQENPSIVPFKSAFWLALILVGLYIATLNFIAVESKGEEGEKKQTSEMTAPAKEAASEEKGEAKTEAVAKQDTAKSAQEATAKPEATKEAVKKPKKKHHDDYYSN